MYVYGSEQEIILQADTNIALTVSVVETFYQSFVSEQNSLHQLWPLHISLLAHG